MQISLHTICPQEPIARQVIALAMENVTHLTLEGVPSSNPWYATTQTAIACEMNAYLLSMGNPKSNIRAELILATEGKGANTEVLGFQLLLPINECPDACGVVYMAVSAHHRRKGIARQLNAAALDRYPHTELSCFIDSVPAFEALGYGVIGGYHTQVRMCTRSMSAAGVMTKLDSQQFARSPRMMEQIFATQAAYSNSALEAAANEIAEGVERRERQAIEFVSKRQALSTGTRSSL